MDVTQQPDTVPYCMYCDTVQLLISLILRLMQLLSGPHKQRYATPWKKRHTSNFSDAPACPVTSKACWRLASSVNFGGRGTQVSIHHQRMMRLSLSQNAPGWLGARPSLSAVGAGLEANYAQILDSSVSLFMVALVHASVVSLPQSLNLHK